MYPARDQKEYDRKIDHIKVCGANRGPHDYIPIKWKQTILSKTDVTEIVTDFMCRVCFTRVSMTTLANLFTEAKM